jgi:dTDP-4-dehydrorhamnose reductase
MTRLLVTGAAGVVGSALAPRFREAYPGCVLVERRSRREDAGVPSSTQCDLESPAAVARLVEEANPDVVVHLAGNKDVFALEKSPELAARANVGTTKHIAEALRGGKTLVVFISSDYVFEGTGGPYRETSPTRPTTAYGKSKLAAEELLRGSGLPVAIARTSSLFGVPNDFVSTVRTALSTGQVFTAFSDLVSNPTAVTDLFEMLHRIIDRRMTGVFHAAGSEAASREAFARKIAAACGLDATLIRGEQKGDRIRPSDLSLDNAATYARLDYCPASIDETLRRRLAAQAAAPTPGR